MVNGLSPFLRMLKPTKARKYWLFEVGMISTKHCSETFSKDYPGGGDSRLLSLNAVHQTTWLLGPHGLDKNVLSLL